MASSAGAAESKRGEAALHAAATAASAPPARVPLVAGVAPTQAALKPVPTPVAAAAAHSNNNNKASCITPARGDMVVGKDHESRVLPGRCVPTVVCGIPNAEPFDTDIGGMF